MWSIGDHYLLIILFISKLAKDISIQGLTSLVDWGLTPAPCLVSKLGARGDGGI